MPKRYQLPEGMTDAIIIEELHISRDELDNCSETELNNRMIYRAVKNTIENGGTLFV